MVNDGDVGWVVAGWFVRFNLEWCGDYIKWCASFRPETVGGCVLGLIENILSVWKIVLFIIIGQCFT